MAINLLTGVPGSGKTYYIVSKALSFIKQEIPVLLDMQCELHPPLSDSPYVFPFEVSLATFNNDGMKSVLEPIQQQYPGKPIILIIDECQRYFPPKFNNEAVKYFFDTHRHFGLDIILATQDKTKLSKEIFVLAESEIRAVSPKVRMFNYFSYRHLIGGIEQSKERLPIDKKIFAMYSTISGVNLIENKKKKFHYLYYAVGVAIIGIPLSLFYVFGVYFPNMGKPTDNKSIQSQSNSTIIHSQPQQQTPTSNYEPGNKEIQIPSDFSSQFTVELGFRRKLPLSSAYKVNFYRSDKQNLALPQPQTDPTGAARGGGEGRGLLR